MYNKMLLREYFEKGVTHEEYMAAFEHTVAAKRTSGPIQTEEYAHYTALNLTRTKRIFKHTELNHDLVEVLGNLSQEVKIICITEFWCGDAAQNNPVVQLMANKTEKLQVKYLFRDENVELMDNYLTHGGRSIPKYILLDAVTGNELANWGPRPVDCQLLMNNLKSSNSTKEEMIETIQRWYNADKTFSLQKEWTMLLQKASSIS